MKIYDEITREEIRNPDLETGCLYNGVIVVGREPERIEVMEDTITPSRPQGLRQRIPAHDITEPCQWYHKYTEDEMAAMQTSDVKKRLAAVEDELQAAKILLGVE